MLESTAARARKGAVPAARERSVKRSDVAKLLAVVRLSQRVLLAESILRITNIRRENNTTCNGENLYRERSDIARNCKQLEYKYQ